MKAINIKTEPYYFKSILSCDVYKAVNEHFKVKISGYITKEIEKNIRFFKSNDQLAIYAEEEGKEQSFFRGRVYNFKIRETRNTYILTINAESNTKLIIEKHGKNICDLFCRTEEKDRRAYSTIQRN